ncbi:MAG TPA: hypothetical protein VD994_06890 [Prosthecobacter sp.]|nr:hypothetical protein [Prosthecobacter sp.]
MSGSDLTSQAAVWATANDIPITDGLPAEYVSKSDRLSKSVEEALRTLRSEICSKELQRADYQVKTFGSEQYARVVIRAPQSFELKWAYSRLMELAKDATIESRPYLLNDGRKLIDSYLHFGYPFMVLIVSMPTSGSPGGGAFKQDGLGMYWVFRTFDASRYQVSDHLLPDGGRIVVPPGVSTMDAYAWFDSHGKQPVRYRHIFQGL